MPAESWRYLLQMMTTFLYHKTNEANAYHSLAEAIKPCHLGIESIYQLKKRRKRLIGRSAGNLSSFFSPRNGSMEHSKSRARQLFGSSFLFYLFRRLNGCLLPVLLLVMLPVFELNCHEKVT